jgi:hypothetical protein
MPGFDPTQKMAHTLNLPFPGQAAAPAKDEGGGGFSFADLLDVVNPLQHLPVIGTLYRAVTGDRIGTIERIAGDGLYGGVIGAATAVADSMFEAVTGKDFGSTVLALFTGGNDEAPHAVAQAAPPATLAANTPPPSPDRASPDAAAFSSALSGHGVDGEAAARALFAYRKAVGLPVLAAN